MTSPDAEFAYTSQQLACDVLAAGCTFDHHSDFGRPVIMLANRITHRYGAEPWRMRAVDYKCVAVRTQVHGTPQVVLAGTPAEAVWDADLAPASDALGIALHEKAALDLLLADLG